MRIDLATASPIQEAWGQLNDITLRLEELFPPYSPSYITLGTCNELLVDVNDIVNNNMIELHDVLVGDIPDTTILDGETVEDIPVEFVDGGIPSEVSIEIVNCGELLNFRPELILFSAPVLDGGLTSDIEDLAVDCATTGDLEFIPVYDCGYAPNSVYPSFQGPLFLEVLNCFNSNIIYLRDHVV